ncbi:nitroreductase family protein [Alkalibacter rhizosphaerae]|uniref:Nitroreductase family protein n=1 Tax=Alkalibacter rhizosphaerae TaxID=2815577 RepID=A0A975AHV7_9FIRM|nr:nitroreductase family protein [Alkalibacter rhizosphaerae]QSX08423.1 nitroreductase family protein [Alkalibacter rhizosphaerae]
MNRTFEYEIMPEIKERWSPRAFSQDAVSETDLFALLEAARYAPSCNNEQPWRFIVAQEGDRLQRMRSILNDGNRRWAIQAPVLILILSKKNFESNGKENHWSMFDAGTAWGYLSLEAQRRGLYTHAMGGYNRNLARSLFSIPDDYQIITVVAVGKPGDKWKLDEDLLDREKPNVRKNLEDLFL